MDLKRFKASLAQAAPPAGVAAPLASLWHQARGDWSAAHRIVQDMKGSNAYWVHAYLHRVEGDIENAGYWYRRAGKPMASTPLQEEWQEIAAALLEE